MEQHLLAEVAADFASNNLYLQKVAQLMLQEGYHYPIFLMSQSPIPVGELLINLHEKENEWYYYAANLDLLVQYRLIVEAEAFKKNYPDPQKCCCVLIVVSENNYFVNLPYSTDLNAPKS